MQIPIGISWQVRRAPGLPYLELSAKIQKIDTFIPNINVLYLQIALQMINSVEEYKGIIIRPFGNVPENTDIFFTAEFESNEDLEKFLKKFGWKRMG